MSERFAARKGAKEWVMSICTVNVNDDAEVARRDEGNRKTHNRRVFDVKVLFIVIHSVCYML